MNPRLQKIQDVLRQLHLLHATEQVRYAFRRLMLQQKNSAFQQANPNFSLPPANLAFDKYAEGKKMYLSFHPPTWVRNTLLKDFDVLKHYSGGFSGMEQDIWIAKSRKM